MEDSPPTEAARTRWEILEQVEDWLEQPMLVLSVVWLALFVVELTRGLSPFLETVGYVIWAVFVLDFALRFTLAPAKGRFLARNALTAVSLVLPALRVFRAARVLRFLRAGRAVRGYDW
jgi:voltage-gated potassium channel